LTTANFQLSLQAMNESRRGIFVVIAMFALGAATVGGFFFAKAKLGHNAFTAPPAASQP
jgi:hypothetical protein